MQYDVDMLDLLHLSSTRGKYARIYYWLVGWLHFTGRLMAE
jgi:hypothetical protein